MNIGLKRIHWWRAAVAGVASLLGVLAGGQLRAATAEGDVRRDAVVEAVEKVMPSVVNIGTKTRLERRGWYYDWWRDNWAPYAQELPPRESAGSGVIIDEDGYVLTNVHVVEGATEIWVNVEGRVIQAVPAAIQPNVDVALLKLKARPGEKFKAAKFASDDDLLLGETVIALGNPFGLGGSVSRGILSSKSRRFEKAEGDDAPMRIPDWLQTDASINPGNSGGPLINLRGEVIGINVAILKEAQGIGFAIPIRRVSEALAEISTPEELKGLWFGARVKPGRLPLKITTVESESPAAKAGLKPGDLVQEINGRIPRGFLDFNQELAAVGEKREVTLRVLRDGQASELNLRLVPEDSFFNADLIRRKLGATLQELTPELAESLSLSQSAGLIVAGVDRSGPAADAGLQRGSVVTALDGQPVTDLVTLARRLHARPAGEKGKFTVIMQRVRGAFVQRGTGDLELKLR